MKRSLVLILTIVMMLTSSSIAFSKVLKSDDYKFITKYDTGEKILLHGTYGNYISVPDLDVQQKRQFRSVWVTTVFNIDFKQTKGSVNEFKNEYTKLLNDLGMININAVTFQVRPCNDAFYKSNLNPWSQFLTGKQGKAPDANFDPLKYMIDEAHKRNMEFHAWFNPFRVTASASKASTTSILNTLAPNNWARKNPKYVINFNGKLMLNPGEIAVQKFIIDTVNEVVKNYDVDAIHFDDYFYPYDSSFGKKNEDMQAFKKYKGKFTSISDWRRNNINSVIQNVNKSIKKTKSYVKFGVSPFGIWRSKYKDATGANVSKGALNSYDTIYADTKKWVKSGWIDYITPQLYWTFGQSNAPYGELADWWANVVKGSKCSLYIGHALYKSTEASKTAISTGDWANEEEILDQLRFNTMYNTIQGSTFFSLSDLRSNPFGITDRLKGSFFSRPAIIPTMPWLDNKAPQKLIKLEMTKTSKNILKWQDSINNDSQYYAVYRFANGQKIDLENPKALIAKVRRVNKACNISYTDTASIIKNQYTYVVTALDRLHNESAGISITK